MKKSSVKVKKCAIVETGKCIKNLAILKLT